jgi:SSS family solute:Na+ symporter
MLLSYSFMVSGLFIPVIMGVFTKKPDTLGAMLAMLGGGALTLTLTLLDVPLPYNLDPIIFGLLVALIIYFIIWLTPYHKLTPGVDLQKKDKKA